MNERDSESDVVVLEEKDRENMGPFDRMIRSGIGGALIGAITAGPGTLGMPQALMAIVAVYPLLTAFLGWDPVYALYEEGQAPVHSSEGRMGFFRWIEVLLYAVWLPVYRLVVREERIFTPQWRLRFADRQVYDLHHRNSSL